MSLKAGTGWIPRIVFAALFVAVGMQLSLKPVQKLVIR
jgi:hypothetical protein